jgi:hypothetical protein
MKSHTRIGIVLLLAASIAACTSTGKGNARSKESVHCKTGEQKVCRGGTATKLDRVEPDPTEFCTCQPRTAPIDHL